MLSMTRRLRLDQAGVSVVEFALALPLLTMLGLGSLEYMNFVLANQKMERVATITADTISRNTMAPNERNFIDTFEAVDKAARPMKIKANGRAILTGVIGVNSNGSVVNKIVWQRCSGSLTNINSQIGTQWTQTNNFLEGPNVTLPNNVVLQQNQMVVVSEVVYRYQPLINVRQLVGASPDGLIRQRSMFVTRGKPFPHITPIQGVNAATCG